jgi:hypothetical protein
MDIAQNFDQDPEYPAQPIGLNGCILIMTAASNWHKFFGIFNPER